MIDSPLYDIAERYRALMDSGLSDEDIADTLDGITDEFDAKAEAIVMVRQNMSATINAIDDEIDRLKSRQTAIENRNERLREYLHHHMTAIGTRKIERPLFTISLVKGRPVAQIDDEDALPDEYVSVTTAVKPDKKAILAALNAGTDINGASLSTTEETVRVR